MEIERKCQRMIEVAQAMDAPGAEIELERLLGGMKKELGSKPGLLWRLKSKLGSSRSPAWEARARALVEAAWRGSRAGVELLVQSGASEQDCYGAFRAAARAGQGEIARSLLARCPKGADFGQAVYELARRGGCLDTRLLSDALELCDEDQARAALCVAARGGHETAVRAILALRPPIDGDSEALEVAWSRGQRSCADLLLPHTDPERLRDLMERQDELGLDKRAMEAAGAYLRSLDEKASLEEALAQPPAEGARSKGRLGARRM